MYRAILRSFIDDYSNNKKNIYKELTEQGEKICRLILDQSGIRAIVTSRVKSETSLLEKIKEKDKSKKYTKIGDIYDDIKDLAGIRIALYFPEDRDGVCEAISNYFDVINTKEFPKLSKRRNYSYNKIFTGYRAKHCIVKIKNDIKFKNYQAEIQIASVLMHSWSEVEHDLIYKPLNGNVTDEEHQILDEINGLVLAGEIALARLQSAVSKRADDNKPFQSKYDLQIFINKYLLTNDPKIEKYNIGRIDYLFEFLKSIEKNEPKKIEKYLNKIDFKDDVSKQLSEIIINLNPKYKNEFIRAVELVERGRFIISEDVLSDYSKMLQKWTDIQKMTQNLSKDIEGPYSKIIKSLTDSYLFDKKIIGNIKQINEVASKAMNNISMIPLQQINKTSDNMSKIIEELNKKLNIQS